MALGPLLFYRLHREEHHPGDGTPGSVEDLMHFVGPEEVEAGFPTDYIPPRQTCRLRLQNCVGECGSSQGEQERDSFNLTPKDED